MIKLKCFRVIFAKLRRSDLTSEIEDLDRGSL